MVSFQGYTHTLGFTAFIIVFGSSFLFGYNIGVLNQVKDVSKILNHYNYSVLNVLIVFGEQWCKDQILPFFVTGNKVLLQPHV